MILGNYPKRFKSKPAYTFNFAGYKQACINGNDHTVSWCSGRNRSYTVFTGVNVLPGTSTSTVFQCAMDPFHNPGSSSAFKGLPFLNFLLMKPVFGSR